MITHISTSVNTSTSLNRSTGTCTSTTFATNTSPTEKKIALGSDSLSLLNLYPDCPHQVKSSQPSPSGLPEPTIKDALTDGIVSRGKRNLKDLDDGTLHFAIG